MFRKFLCYGGFSLLTTLFGVLSLPVLISFLEPSEYGVLGLTLTVLSLLVPFNTFSNEHNVQSLKLKLSTIDYNHYWAGICTFSIIVCFGGLLVTGLVVYFFDFHFSFLLIPLLSFLRSLRLLKQAEFAVSEQDFLYGLSSLLISVFAFIVTFLVFYFYESSATLRVAGLLFAEIIVVLYIAKVRFSFEIDKKTLKNIVLFGLPLVLSSLPYWLISESSRFFLLKYSTLERVGLYTLAFQISVIYLQFNTVLANTYVKKVFENINVSFEPLFILKITFIQVICAVGFVLLINILGIYFLPESYIAALPITNLLIAGVLFQSFGMLPTFYLGFHRKNKYRLFSFSGAAVIAVALNFSLIPLYGVKGAAIAFIVAMFSYATFITWFVYRLISRDK